MLQFDQRIPETNVKTRARECLCRREKEKQVRANMADVANLFIINLSKKLFGLGKKKGFNFFKNKLWPKLREVLLCSECDNWWPDSFFFLLIRSKT